MKRLKHYDSDGVAAEVGEWVWKERPVISSACAVTIASYYHSPNDPALTELSTCQSVSDGIALRHEILTNGRQLGHPVDLAALLAWADRPFWEWSS